MMTISSEKMLPAVIVRCCGGWIKIAGRVSFINDLGPFSRQILPLVGSEGPRGGAVGVP